MATKKTIRATVLCALFASVCTPAQSTLIYVDDDAPPGGDGSSWATAYTFLQDALTEGAATAEAVEIRVAQGTYRPDRDAANPGGTGDREASFELLSGLTLAGGYVGVGASDPNARDWEAHLTILSGDLLGDDATGVDPCDFRDDVTREENSLNVVTARAFATLDGVVVTGGHAMPFRCTGRGSCPDVVPADGFCGGGVLVEADGVTLRHCRFERNFGDMMGGGAFVYRGDNFIVQACTFFENGAGRGGAQGGGLHARESTVTIRESQFFDNWTQSKGAGFYCWHCELVVAGCTFQRNRADWAGGAFSTRGGTAFISDSAIIACSAGRRGGGGISV
ncbi:MAG: right-handed parallel beta-helix repeat-containing protein, partial [Sedimentisphaerales bacterium]|nr:right-handed parallel beta-helix repeat-containing protein [Sedimentisphaerales bacterium]